MKPEVKLIPPDGGWGWLVAIGAILVAVIPQFLITIFPILYSDILLEYDADPLTISWIFNLFHMIWSITEIFVASLCAQFGWRKVAFSGGILLGIATIITAFATSSAFLFFSYSFLGGVGSGVAFPTWHFIIPQYFDKRRGRVFGVISASFSTNQFVAPLMMTGLQSAYGTRGAILIIGGLALNVCVGASLFHPVEWHLKKSDQVDSSSNIDETVILREEEMKPEMDDKRQRVLQMKKSMRDSIKHGSVSSLDVYIPINAEAIDEPDTIDSKSAQLSGILLILKLVVKNIFLLKYVSVILISIIHTVTVFTYTNMIMLVPFTIVNRNHSMQVAATAMTIMGITNIFSRFIFSSLTDALPNKCKWLYIGGALTTAASIFSLSLAFEEIWIYVSAGMIGVGIGCILPLTMILLIEILGKKLFPPTVGICGLLRALFFLTIGALLGYVRKSTENFALCLQLLSILLVLSIILLLFEPIAKKIDKKRIENFPENF